MSGQALQDRRGYEEPDEQIALINAINEAETRGDEETVRRLTRKLEPPADVLLGAKMASGADFIRERGYITRLAEKKYGKDWLEKSNEELMEIRTRLGPGDKNE